MNIEKINKFIDYIYDEKSMCWYGENLEEEYELTQSKCKEILQNPNPKDNDLDDLIDQFFLLEDLIKNMYDSISKVDKVINSDLVLRSNEEIDIHQLSICKEILNLKEVSV